LVGVEQWAEVRRMHRVEGLSGREISRRTGLARDTVARLLAASDPPKYQREQAGSKLDPFKDWICEQLAGDPIELVAAGPMVGPPASPIPTRTDRCVTKAGFTGATQLQISRVKSAIYSR
jgi:hypothetical protein